MKNTIMGCTTVKTVKGRDYLYYSYYLDGKKMQSYCGIVGTPISRQKALDFEIIELKTQKKHLSETIKMKKLEKEKSK